MTPNKKYEKKAQDIIKSMKSFGGKNRMLCMYIHHSDTRMHPEVNSKAADINENMYNWKIKIHPY